MEPTRRDFTKMTSALIAAAVALNSIRWQLRDRQPITVTGDGLLEVYGWETEPGYALHLVNHTSPGFRGSATRGLCPLGAQEVRMTLPNAKRVKRTTLLRSGRALAVRQDRADV